MDFTTLFLENLTGISGPSGLMSIGGLGLSSIGMNLMDSDNAGLETMGALSVTLASSLILDGENAYEKTKQQLELTQAYVESLNQEELEDLIVKLESKENELSRTEDIYVRKLER